MTDEELISSDFSIQEERCSDSDSCVGNYRPESVGSFSDTDSSEDDSDSFGDDTNKETELTSQL